MAMLNNQRVFAGSIHLLFLSCFELWKKHDKAWWYERDLIYFEMMDDEE